MFGTITEYMGTAYTGLGISHKYDKLIAAASETVFLKCPPTHSLSAVLNEAAMQFVKRGFHIDRFMNPVQPDKIDAIFVKDANVFIIQASHPIALEPADIGGRHKVISYYDVYDERKLRELNGVIVENLETAEVSLKKALQSLRKAKKIHDDWEQVNIARMMWPQHETLIQSLKEELFGNIHLNKEATVSHRLIGSLTSSGAQDFIPSITKPVERRMLIKGLPGTGKSTLMKAVGAEAEKRGFDVLYGWCGLDPAGVDLVQIPELSICIFDATKPHAYDPERPGDEILDLVHMCEENEEAEEKIIGIQEIYSEAILDATGYMQAYAQSENSMKATMDTAIMQPAFETKSQKLLEYVGDVLK
ncbi:hypothetical protein [Sporosarcina sp. HYO08]|uniref:hypothetical protein n=1 Tax=Sporosarcina sp. HYO08 TaxID=1759557 RepID=UPI0007989D27|nr:hypothetical protein [Sporosarcina sp. HYO08]KXH83904.1 hypothetical protein AU377_03900 [Sporosarcina sp. HYO08]